MQISGDEMFETTSYKTTETNKQEIFQVDFLHRDSGLGTGVPVFPP